MRFLTFSCFRRVRLFQAPEIRDRFAERLARSCEACRVALFAWVVMPNHIHLLLTPCLPEYPVSRFLEHLKTPFAREVLGQWRALDVPILERLRDARGHLRFWQAGGGYDHNMYSPERLPAKIDYIHDNPRRWGLVERAIDWRWSSARWYDGILDPGVPEINPLPL